MKIFSVLAMLHLTLMLGVSVARIYDFRAAPAPVVTASNVPLAPDNTGRGWFDRMKPYCNSVEVLTAVQRTPPPSHRDSAGYQAACYSLAGKISEADTILAGLGPDPARYAAGIVFSIGHPVADAGDDDSAGPIMRLVVKYDPRSYMALYHSGMSSYNLGDTALARDHLNRFLEIYKSDDGWRRNGLKVLARIESGERGSVFSGKTDGE